MRIELSIVRLFTAISGTVDCPPTEQRSLGKVQAMCLITAKAHLGYGYIFLEALASARSALQYTE